MYHSSREIPQNYHTFAFFHFPKMGNWMTLALRSGENKKRKQNDWNPKMESRFFKFIILLGFENGPSSEAGSWGSKLLPKHDCRLPFLQPDDTSSFLILSLEMICSCKWYLEFLFGTQWRKLCWGFGPLLWQICSSNRKSFQDKHEKNGTTTHDFKWLILVLTTPKI